MLLFGCNLISSNDTLKKVKVEYLYHSLRNPKPEIVSKINQLRIIRNLNTKQYATLKRQLPYIVCGIFNPPYRKTENFAYTEYFIVDIDHIYDKGLDIHTLRKKVESDKRVLLTFISPSEDGLKILFRLKERCYDSGLYSICYKLFLKELSATYNLEQVIDEKTSDVCRACFISIDPDAYYNPEAEEVDFNAYLKDKDVNELITLKTEFKEEEKEIIKSSNLQKKEDIDPDSETMQKIKELLNPRAKNINKSAPFVPGQLEEIIDDLKKYINQTGVELYEVINIQYGKKLRMKMGYKLAEINLFYGKNGFTVVQSPRCGTSQEFNLLMSELVKSFIYEIT